MSQNNAGRDFANARRGLATIALLKARFDEGLDHLSMFQPFVDDAICNYKADDIDVQGIQKAIQESVGLSVPAEIVMTLLTRARKKGLLQRHGGRFLRTSNKIQGPEYSAQIQRFLRAHKSLASHLRQFASSRGYNLASDDDALSIILHFLDARHIGLVLGQPISVESSDTTTHIDQVVAAFVTSVAMENGPLRVILDDIVKGLIIQNALLLRDIPITRRNLKGLTVFLDTGVLLRVLGYGGPTEELAAKEALSLIHAAGANLRVFEGTVNEVEGILGVYERKLGSPAAIKTLRPTSLTYHFLSTKATPSDIHQEIVLLRTNLERLGIKTREFPEHTTEYTEDEIALANALKDPASNDGGYDERIWHDVQAVAAVLTLRKGAEARRMAYSKYVFASNSTSVVASATQWYREKYPHIFEPMVHFRSITNAAWFIRPANASNVPMHELVAVCAAVLQPSNELWTRFVKGLDDLVQSGELSHDESISVLATGFTHIESGEIDTESDFEANNLREIVERVRRERESELRSEMDTREKQIEDRERAAAVAQYEANSVRTTVQARANRLAMFAAKGIYTVICIILLLGALFSLPTVWSDWNQYGTVRKVFGWVCIVTFLGATLLPFFTRRFHGFGILDRLHTMISFRLQRMLLPEFRQDQNKG